MIRVGLFAKQTQVFDKKADQMLASKAGKSAWQVTSPRHFWRLQLCWLTIQRSPCDIAPRQSVTCAGHYRTHLIRFFKAFLALFSVHAWQA
ncbi:hypothetical protein OU800_16195 [Pseudomonas sp. GOM7]|uniref:hypothetical protein n=1 Tax=unclassified Pseudomonas TaxID=196821 RepID=UPI00227CE557|nr:MULTISPECIES: hypothetical protein [unclassified Pseudomonas]WAJ36152.1 hypothetical protein OU800_16195 [Pseudomonas sp. GOM7]